MVYCVYVCVCICWPLCNVEKYEEQKKQVEQLQQTRDQVRVSALTHIDFVYMHCSISCAELSSVDVH